MRTQHRRKHRHNNNTLLTNLTAKCSFIRHRLNATVSNSMDNPNNALLIRFLFKFFGFISSEFAVIIDALFNLEMSSNWNFSFNCSNSRLRTSSQELEIRVSNPISFLNWRKRKNSRVHCHEISHILSGVCHRRVMRRRNASNYRRIHHRSLSIYHFQMHCVSRLNNLIAMVRAQWPKITHV